ncbi:pinin-like [Pyrus x bretschneideri]|uniref:pinin-like n=1 Tax=Pyrus x bretschneideri TaxID=225117 RepID=UPI00202FC986|nr:pinin-like [Pyrus x bretschneideri]
MNNNNSTEQPPFRSHPVAKNGDKFPRVSSSPSLKALESQTNMQEMMSALLQDRSEFPISREESTISEQNPNGETNSMDLNSRKRKSVSKGKAKDPPPLSSSRSSAWPITCLTGRLLIILTTICTSSSRRLWRINSNSSRRSSSSRRHHNSVGSSAGLSGNERLPGSVLLARERLLKRLRGMPPSETRRHRALHLYRDGLLHVDDLSPLVRDWDAEILTSQPATAYSSTNLGSQIERLHLLQEANKKPPGLSQEVLDCLSTDIFSSAEVGVDGLVLKASGDCSICLESFTDGD